MRRILRIMSVKVILRNLVVGLSLFTFLATAQGQSFPAVNTQHPRDQIALQLGAALMGYTVPFKLSASNMQEACNALVMGRNALDAAVGRPAVKVRNAQSSPNVESLEYRDQLYSAVERVVTSPVAGALKGSVVLENGKKVAVNVKLTAPPNSWTIPVPFAFESRTAADVALEAEILALTNTLNSLSAQVASLKEGATVASGTLSQNLAALVARTASLETNAGTAAATLAALSQSLGLLSSRATTLETNAGTAASTAASLSQSVASLAIRATSLETSAGTAASSVASLSQNLTALSSRMASVEAGASTAASSVASLSQNLTALSSRMASVEAGSSATTSSVASLSQNLTALTSRMAAVEAGSSAAASSVASLSQTVNSFSATISAANAAGTPVKLAADFSHLKTTLLHAGAVLDYGLTSVTTLAGGTVVPEEGEPYSEFTADLRGPVLDALGNLYLFDRGVIKKVTPAGVVSVLAGGGESGGVPIDGTGSSASFSGADSLIADASGTLYLIDAGGIRKVTPQGVVTTLSLGTEEAPVVFEELSDLDNMSRSRLAADGLGNLYAIGYDNSNSSRILLKIAPSGEVSRFTSSWSEQEGADSIDGAFAVATISPSVGPIATDGVGNLYLAEISPMQDENRGHKIRKVSPQGTVTTLAVVERSILFNLTEIVADRSGNVFLKGTSEKYLSFIAEYSILKVPQGGPVTLLLGPGAVESDRTDEFIKPRDGVGQRAALGGNVGPLRIDALGNLYFPDSGLVRKATPEGVLSTLAGGGWGEGEDVDGYQAAFSAIRGIAVDGSGNVYVVDTLDEGFESPAKIRKVSASP
jgi:hypothetical protein